MQGKIKKQKIAVPTYPIGEAEPLPLYFEKRPYQGASGKVYPIPYNSSLSDTKEKCCYDFLVLENEWVRVELLPALGGKVYSALDKTNGYDFIYRNKVLKPAMVGLAGPWGSGGIEFNFPQHHRPSTYLPADWKIAGSGDKRAAYMGEYDWFYGMKASAAFSLHGSCLRAEITVYNASPEEHPFMWWANMAVEVNDKYQIVFPPDVEYVNDHDRRAVLSWPIARGEFKTARPYDYGEGTDIHPYSAVIVPSSFMVSRWQSDGDFLCGYDAGRQAGVVTVSDHRIAPGKKLWTWGVNKFGDKWCANLTDDGSKYVELMTGCYTDNQPDFSWIAPYETKKFVQVWYPVRDIGEVKFASEQCAVNLEQCGDAVFVGVYTTDECAATVTLDRDGEVIWCKEVSVSPARPFTESVAVSVPCADLTLKVCSGGRELAKYRQPARGVKSPIEPRKPSPRPQEIETVEELWLHGRHLRQYKHFAYRAENYFSEALARDPSDIRCNTEMGDLAFERGVYSEAIGYYTAALKKAMLRNCVPYDTAPFYKRALCFFYEGKLEEAYEDAYAALWSFPQRSASYYLLAKIAAKRGQREQAVEFLRHSLETNSGHLWAEYVQGILTDDIQIEQKIARKDPLFFPDFSSERCALLFADELMQFGLNARAEEILQKTEDRAMKFYYLAYLEEEPRRKTAYLDRADACPWQREFPSGRISEQVLRSAGTPRAQYYLGCIYYASERYADACAAWERSVRNQPFAPAYRNLALGYYDHLGKAEQARACLERAHDLMPESDRIFYELTQLYKSMNVSKEERLRLYRENLTLTEKRDDCTLGYSQLLTVCGNWEGAKDVLLAHRFHTYEGGEGNLTQHHAWLSFLRGKTASQDAEHILESGLVFPENYGEEKTYFANDAPLWLELARRRTGEARREALENAVSSKGPVTVQSYYACLAYRELGMEDAAAALAGEMIRIGKQRIRDADIEDYFGVGATTYPPFGYDVVRAHVLSGSMLCAFGFLAMGNDSMAVEYMQKAKTIDCADFSVYLFETETDRSILQG